MTKNGIVYFVISILIFSNVAFLVNSENLSIREIENGKFITSSRSLSESAWPMFNGNNQHTGLSEFSINDNTGSMNWKFKTNGSVRSSPVIDSSGTIYFGSDDDHLYAVNPNGSLKWIYKTYGNITTTPAIDTNGIIYVASDDANIYSILPNGSLNWKYSTADKLKSSPAIGDDGTIYFGSDDENCYAVNSDGTLKWKYKTSGSVRGSPAICYEGTIYFLSSSYSNSYLYALSLEGKLNWKYKTHTPSSTPMIDDDRNIYFFTNSFFEDNFFIISPDGKKEFSRRIANPIMHSSSSIDMEGNLYFGSNYNFITAFDESFERKWSFETSRQSENPNSPTISLDGNILFGSTDTYFYLINQDGTLFWKFRTGGEIHSSCAIDPKGNIYFGSNDNYLYCLGVEKSHLPLPPDNLGSVFSDNRVILSWEESKFKSNQNIIDYDVYKGNELGSEQFIASINDGTMSYMDTDVVPGETYYYYIVSKNEFGESSPSESEKVITQIKMIKNNWTIIEVDKIDARGSASSVAIDSNNNPHLCYFDRNDEPIKYSKQTELGWEILDIYSPSGSVTYSAIQLDSMDKPHILYLEERNNRLIYAKLDSGILNYTVIAYRVKDRVSFSLAIDSKDKPHISYCSGNKESDEVLWYGVKIGDIWRTKIVDESSEVGLFSSIALDSMDNPSISYYDSENGNLKYAYLIDDNWKLETIDVGPEVGMYNSLSMDRFNVPHISYYDNLNKNLRYAFKSGDEWLIETIDHTEDVGRHSSIAIDSKNNVHICYIDTYNKTYKYTKIHNSGLIETEPYFQITNEYFDSCINKMVLDNEENIIISFYGNNSMCLAIKYKMSKIDSFNPKITISLINNFDYLKDYEIIEIFNNIYDRDENKYLFIDNQLNIEIIGPGLKPEDLFFDFKFNKGSEGSFFWEEEESHLWVDFSEKRNRYESCFQCTILPILITSSKELKSTSNGIEISLGIKFYTNMSYFGRYLRDEETILDAIIELITKQPCINLDKVQIKDQIFNFDNVKFPVISQFVNLSNISQWIEFSMESPNRYFDVIDYDIKDDEGFSILNQDNVFYTGKGSEPEILIVEKPTSGKFEIEVTTTKELYSSWTYYDLKINSINENEIIDEFNKYQQKIDKDKSHKFNVELACPNKNNEKESLNTDWLLRFIPIFVLFLVIFLLIVFINYKRKRKEKLMEKR